MPSEASAEEGLYKCAMSICCKVDLLELAFRHHVRNGGIYDIEGVPQADLIFSLCSDRREKGMGS
jgi:hypothetical protein